MESANANFVRLNFNELAYEQLKSGAGHFINGNAEFKSKDSRTSLKTTLNAEFTNKPENMV